jgi:hypothetical protein
MICVPARWKSARGFHQVAAAVVLGLDGRGQRRWRPRIGRPEAERGLK